MAKDLSLAERLQFLNQFGEEVQAEKDVLINKAMRSDNPTDIVFANKMVRERAAQGQKSYLIDPLSTNEFNGYRTRNFETGFGALRSMAVKTPLIAAILQTRKEQVAAYNSYSSTSLKPGWKIEKNVENYFNDSAEFEKESALSISDKQEIRKCISFIENCGIVKRSFYGDNFDSFLRKFVDDSLTLDQACFEVIPSQTYKPFEFLMIDGATVRFASGATMDQEGKERGYYPHAVQLYQGTSVANTYYPWELAIGIRNPSTNISYNGYGISELELLTKVVTWILYSEAYNGKFFSQGSNPKGFFLAKGNLTEDKIAEFKQSWTSQVAGLNGAFKIPILSGGDIQFIDTQKSNSDMEFDKWLEYLTKLTCAIYKIDPKELGFDLNNNTVTYDSSIQEKLTYSKEKGLVPLLKFIEKQINKYIIHPLTDNKFSFRFCGVDNSDQLIEKSDLDKVKDGVMSFKEYRVKYNLPSTIESDDFLLNSTWIQYKQMLNTAQQQQQGQQMGGEEQGGDENDFNSLIQRQKEARGGEEKMEDNVFHSFTIENPFVKDLDNFVEKAFINKQ